MKYAITMILTVVIVVTLGISWDIYRWHTFQKVTASDIGYFKWKMVIDGSNSSKRR